MLRSGSLPIPVQIEEERTIGPALGADSIRRGIQASVASLLAVLVFAVVYYRMSGVYATIAISVGMLMIVGLMSMFGATLTMPGIAGLVLTVGMAIDGNVMIFERIREELRRGKTPRAAIRTGFSRALPPILDGQHHHDDHGARALRVRHRPDQGLRGDAGDRPGRDRVPGASSSTGCSSTSTRATARSRRCRSRRPACPSS